MTESWARRIALAVAILAIGAAIAVGLYLAGSPAAERERRLDARRVGDLQQTARAIDVYWTRRHKLPASLEDLPQEPGLSVPDDPVTGAAYVYRRTGETSYELCADFKGESEQRGRDFWTHGSGRHCFALEVRNVKP